MSPGLPYATPTRLDLAAAIAAGEVTGYPGWTPPRATADRVSVALTDVGRAWVARAEART